TLVLPTTANPAFVPNLTEQPFQSAESFYPPSLVAQADTPMGEAIHQGLAMVRQRKDEYRENGISYYRPWVFLITDGGPTDEWQSAAAAIREGEASKAFAFFAVGVQGANMEILQQISVKEPLMLDGLKFRDLFTLFRRSITIHSWNGSSIETAYRMGICVSWRTVSASTAGTAHIATGGVCQDSCLAFVESIPEHEPLLCIFVADGAGSATFGGSGAELAVETAASFFTKKCMLPEFGFYDELAVECVLAIRQAIGVHAENKELPVRDYACTFLGVISSSQGTLVMQIGDGGIVIDTGAGLCVPIIPMTGEYANMTYFITDDNAIEVLATEIYSEKLLKVAAFTDGIQRLALNMASNTPYEPFFTPFFRGLANATVEQEDHLQASLVQFLN
ncbi:unnamed protein product, partial [Cyprideis torosa]